MLMLILLLHLALQCVYVGIVVLQALHVEAVCASKMPAALPTSTWSKCPRAEPKSIMNHHEILKSAAEALCKCWTIQSWQ